MRIQHRRARVVRHDEGGDTGHLDGASAQRRQPGVAQVRHGALEGGQDHIFADAESGTEKFAELCERALRREPQLDFARFNEHALDCPSLREWL